MSIRLSCPSCNTGFVLPALPDHRRATCPRCGDVFPIRTYTEAADRAEPVVEEEGTPARTGSVPRWSRWIAIGAAVVLAVGVVVLLGAVYDTGRKIREILKEPPAPKDVTTATAPTQLTGLCYLRADCNIAFAVQVGPLLAFAERTNQQPRDVLTQTGLPDPVRNTIEQLGVPLEQIDHIAGGLLLGEGEDALRLTLVLVLKQPLADEAEFLKALKAKPAAGKKSRQEVTVGRFPLTLARVSPTVWVFGLDDRDFDAVDKGGFAPGAAQFRGGAEEESGLRSRLAGLPPDAAVWVAADDDHDWTQKPILKLVGQSPEAKKWLSAAKDGRGGSVAVSLGDKPRVKVSVRAAESATAERVRAYFTARAAETESAAAGGSGRFAHFDAPFDATNTGKLLQRFLTDAGR